ncbi:hypothetical protein IWQ62_000323 [Dispira parvispora]|uniref:Nudix hydrolase domain-containing protein n=1 Tax=Dispira parvispora TaxID=1520584 RepID=A0A9W8AYL1_9FUNG|nr:hypothetical protein IWQ62_000323 [Dispira parvispora]
MTMRRADGVRQVSGGVPIDYQTKKILLISSRQDPQRYILPKGGWERNETREEGAVRETFEEAGLEARVVNYLGTWDLHPKKDTERVKCEMAFYELAVDKVHDEWPEKEERRRMWVTFNEALGLLSNPIMLKAVEKCSLNPTSSLPNECL